VPFKEPEPEYVSYNPLAGDIDYFDDYGADFFNEYG
jgi:hypothetical protein